jgi:glutaredoxin 3
MNDASEFWQALRDYNMKTFSNKQGVLDLDNLVEIWGKPGCPYCERSKQICKKFGLNYIYHQLDEDFTREELLEKFPYAKTFPQIIVDGEYVGGHDDFVKYKNTVLKDD